MQLGIREIEFSDWGCRKGVSPSSSSSIYDMMAYDDVSSISSSTSSSMKSIDAPIRIVKPRVTKIYGGSTNHIQGNKKATQVNHNKMNSDEKQYVSSLLNHVMSPQDRVNIPTDPRYKSPSMSERESPSPIPSRKLHKAVSSTLSIPAVRDNNDDDADPVVIRVIDMDSFYRTLRIEKKRESKRRIEKNVRYHIYPVGDDNPHEENHVHLRRMILRSKLHSSSSLSTTNTSVQNLASNSISSQDQQDKEEEEDGSSIQDLLHGKETCTTHPQLDLFLLQTELDLSMERQNPPWIDVGKNSSSQDNTLNHDLLLLPHSFTEGQDLHKRIFSNPTDTTATSTSSIISMDAVDDDAFHTPYRSSCSSNHHLYQSSSPTFEEEEKVISSPVQNVSYSSSNDESSLPTPPPPLPRPRVKAENFISSCPAISIPSCHLPLDESISYPCPESKEQCLVLSEESPSPSVNDGTITVSTILDRTLIKQAIQDMEEEEDGPGKIISIAAQQKSDSLDWTCQSSLSTQMNLASSDLDTTLQHTQRGFSQTTENQDDESLSNYKIIQLREEFLNTNHNTTTCTMTFHHTPTFLGNVKNNSCPFDEHSTNSISSCITDANIGTRSVTDEQDDDDNNSIVWNETPPTENSDSSKKGSEMQGILPSLSHSFDTTSDMATTISKSEDTISKKSRKIILTSSSACQAWQRFVDTSDTCHDWDDFNQEVQLTTCFNKDPFFDTKADLTTERPYEWLESELDDNGFPNSSRKKTIPHLPPAMKNTPVKSTNGLKNWNISTSRASGQKMNNSSRKSNKPHQRMSTQENENMSRESATRLELCRKSASCPTKTQSDPNAIQYLRMTEDGSISTYTKDLNTIHKSSGSLLLKAVNIFHTKEQYSRKCNDMTRSDSKRFPWTKTCNINTTYPNEMNRIESSIDSYPLLMESDIGSIGGTHSRQVDKMNTWQRVFRRNGTNLSLEKLYQGKTIHSALSFFSKPTLKQLNSSIQTSDLVAAVSP